MVPTYTMGTICLMQAHKKGKPTHTPVCCGFPYEYNVKEALLYKSAIRSHRLMNHLIQNLPTRQHP